MKYLILFVLILIIAGLYFYLQLIKYDSLSKYHLKKKLKALEASKDRFYYSTDCINKRIRAKSSAFYEAFELGFDNAKSAIKELLKLNHSNKVNIALSDLYFFENDLEKSLSYLCQAEPKNISDYWKGKYFYLKAFFAMQEADMMYASADISKSISFFEKQKAYYEQAQAIMLSAEIYKLSTMFDVAEISCNNAKKIFAYLGCISGQASALGSLGMLTMLQERYDDAKQYFAESSSLFAEINNNSGQGNVANQQALLYLVNNDCVMAKDFAQRAVLLNSKNNIGLAHSYDVMSFCFSNLQDYESAKNYAQMAEKLHSKAKNYTAKLEAMYQHAICLDKLNQEKKSEDILRKIISESKKHKTGFYVANAYNQLGMIFLRKKDYKRAKALFSQSVMAEHQGSRLNAIALDYLNIAFADYKIGNQAEALKTLNTSLEYALACEDEELCSLIKERINKYQA